MRLEPTSSIVILTGAGVSAESGLATFRDSGGLWENHRVEDVATPEAFARDPVAVHRFYNQRRAQLRIVEPNAAHQALARLQAAWPGGVLLVTQNVDDLHERGGSQAVLHMHGELRKARCTSCHSVHRWEEDLGLETPCPACGHLGGLRPHIVWFGELPFELERIYEELWSCGLFLAIGTSGQVYPADGFVEGVSPSAYTLEINRDKTEASTAFLGQRLGLATDRVPELVEELLANLRRPA